MSPKVDLKFLNYGWCSPGADLPGKAGEMDQSDVPGAWGRAGGGPHVWPGLPSVRYLRHPVHHDTKAMSLGQWPTWQWVVSTFRVTFSRDFALASNATSNDWQFLKIRKDNYWPVSCMMSLNCAFFIFMHNFAENKFWVYFIFILIKKLSKPIS